MSDLYIEARLQAIKDIASASCVDIKDADNIASFCDEIYSAIPNLDKVVEELKSLQTYNMGLATLMSDLQRNGVCRHYVCLEDVIEIVKQGGIKNINHKVCIPDVCEWKDNGTYGYVTSCTEFRSNIANKDTYWEYCPYCSKKIKVVEMNE